MAYGSSASGYDVQDRGQDDRRRLGEVQQLRRLVEDGAGVAQVGVDVPVDARLGAVEQRAGVREDDGIVVDVDDPGLRGDGLGDLVGAARRRDAGAEVEELPYPRLGGEVAHGAAEERPVRPRGEGHVRPDLERFLGSRPVGGVVVLSTQQVVVHPGLVRRAGIERQRAEPARGAALFWRRCLVAGHLAAFPGRCRTAWSRVRRVLVTCRWQRAWRGPWPPPEETG